MIALFSFLATPLGKFVSLVVGIISLATILIGLKMSYDSSLANRILLEYNNKQLELSIKSNEIIRQSLDELKIESDKISKELRESRESSERQAEEINRKIDEAKYKDADEISPEILRETIRQLRGIK